MKMLGRYLLDKKPAAKRKKKGCTFNEANSVAILYQDNGEDHFKKIKSIVADLHREYGIKSVLAMGFVDQKKKALPIYQFKKLEYTYLCKDDLKWNKLPNHEADQFMNQEFDLLLDLFQEEHLALEYLWKGSKAKMKVSTNSSICASTADLIAATEKQTDIKSIFKTYQHLLTKYNLK